jgi:hypothetical protein
MIMRDANGNLHVINRCDCKNDKVYYQKLFSIRESYVPKFKTVVPKLANKVN